VSSLALCSINEGNGAIGIMGVPWCQRLLSGYPGKALIKLAPTITPHYFAFVNLIFRGYPF